jgi:hypothetical protein
MPDATSSRLTRPALDEQAAEDELVTLTAPLDATAATSPHLAAFRLSVIAVMTAAGAGLHLAAAPGAGSRAFAAACSALIGIWLAGPLLARGRRQRATVPAWAHAASIHERSLPARIPAQTLAAARRYLRAIAAGNRQTRAWLYVPRCPGNGRHTWRCEAAAVWQPQGGLMVVLGEHLAADPVVAAVILAHEQGHRVGWPRGAFAVLNGGRSPFGWGWAAAGLAGASLAGWPGVLAFAAAFHVVSLLAVWAAEIACDRHAAGAEGRAAVLYAFASIAIRQAARRAATPRWRRAMPGLSAWLAGPSHPPLALRRALIRATTRS